MVVAEVCSSMKYPKRCQYKHAKQKKYHVRNWAEYNEGLRRRGDLTVWFDEEAIANWKADKTGKPGGQRVYSDMAIETGLVVRMVYKLAYRQTEGFLHSIASLLGLGIEIPDYSTLCRRSTYTEDERAAIKQRFATEQAIAGAPRPVVEYLDLVGPAIPLADEMGAGRKRTLRERRRRCLASRSPWQPERAGLWPNASHGSGTGVRTQETQRMKTRESERGGAAPKACSQTRRKLAKSKPSKTTFRPTPVSCGITERSLLCSIKSSLMKDFRVRSSLPVARHASPRVGGFQGRLS